MNKHGIKIIPYVYDMHQGDVKASQSTQPVLHAHLISKHTLIFWYYKKTLGAVSCSKQQRIEEKPKRKAIAQEAMEDVWRETSGTNIRRRKPMQLYHIKVFHIQFLQIIVLSLHLNFQVHEQEYKNL